MSVTMAVSIPFSALRCMLALQAGHVATGVQHAGQLGGSLWRRSLRTTSTPSKRVSTLRAHLRRPSSLRAALLCET